MEVQHLNSLPVAITNNSGQQRLDYQLGQRSKLTRRRWSECRRVALGQSLVDARDEHDLGLLQLNPVRRDSVLWQLG